MVNNNITNRVCCSRRLGGRGSYPQEVRVQRVKLDLLGDTLPPATSGIVCNVIILKHFFLQNCLFCLIIVNKSNYFNKITSEVVKLSITKTHSDISRGHSPLGILSKVFCKSEWRPSWKLLIHRP